MNNNVIRIITIVILIILMADLNWLDEAKIVS